jgi:flagellar basal-body rod modification protein FlgD
MATDPVSAASAGGATASSTPRTQDLRGLNMDHFLQLMLAELQNQDPLNPLDNKDLLAQISQIRQIGATAQLQETLDAVLRGQNLASASGMIGRSVRALSTDGGMLEGVVDRVSLSGESIVVHVGTRSAELGNVSEMRL